ncbi:hypothetical protein Misp01_02420 [Microtetraspora sp. NBRC 13810]|nr:hypothetical protein Misp01_02420 [Microtetraspora sp. NBRC 13810]
MAEIVSHSGWPDMTSHGRACYRHVRDVRAGGSQPPSVRGPWNPCHRSTHLTHLPDLPPRGVKAVEGTLKLYDLLHHDEGNAE